MNDANTKKLLKKYPKIFRQHTLPMDQTCMCWLFECGDGWFYIIDNLCELIQWCCDQTQYRPIKDLWYYRCKLNDYIISNVLPSRLYWYLIPKFNNSYLPLNINIHQEKYKIDQIEAIQVKEKFGGLRFYTNYYNEEINGAIALSNLMSYKTCETCGITQNVTQSKGWIVTLCKKCHSHKWIKRQKTIKEV